MPGAPRDWGDSETLSLSQIWEKFERLKLIKDEAEGWCCEAHKGDGLWTAPESIHQRVLDPIETELDGLVRIASRLSTSSPKDIRCKALILTCSLQTHGDPAIVELASSLECDLRSCS